MLHCFENKRLDENGQNTHLWLKVMKIRMMQANNSKVNLLINKNLMEITMAKSFRSSAGFGKRMEYKLVGDMLMEGLDCYIPLVDDHGVDCVIKKCNT